MSTPGYRCPDADPGAALRGLPRLRQEGPKAGLRLDLRDSALARKAIVPGNPGASKLIARVHSADESEVMPPPEAHKLLSPRQKQVLQRWIEQGAEYQLHWSFQPPTAV